MGSCPWVARRQAGLGLPVGWCLSHLWGSLTCTGCGPPLSLGTWLPRPSWTPLPIVWASAALPASSGPPPVMLPDPECPLPFCASCSKSSQGGVLSSVALASGCVHFTAWMELQHLSWAGQGLGADPEAEWQVGQAGQGWIVMGRVQVWPHQQGLLVRNGHCPPRFQEELSCPVVSS